MLAITLGDPKSINIRSILHLLSDIPGDIPALIIGSRFVWERQIKEAIKLGINAQASPKTIPSLQTVLSVRDPLIFQSGIKFLDVTADQIIDQDNDLTEKTRAFISVGSLMALEEISEACEHNESKLSVLTCPIDKKIAQDGGFRFPGQTEFFEHLWSGRSVMVLAGEKLRVGLATNHLPLSKVPHAITTELIISKCKIFEKVLKDICHKPSPKIIICGLNPHLSDQGLFGDEEENIIKPAFEKLKQMNIDVTLAPADTAFYFAYQGSYDGVLAMYHDQGLGPLKTVHFDSAINITGGLKHLRVSPDHGPVADKLTDRNISIQSFKNALACCLNHLNGK